MYDIIGFESMVVMMKVIKGIGKGILGIIVAFYILVSIFITVCLVNYNDYSIAVIGDRSIITADDNSLNPDFKKGDLLVVKKNDNEDVKINDSIFFYNNYKNVVSVNMAKVTNSRRINDMEYTFTVDGDYDISSEYFIGKVDTTVKYDKIGRIYDIFTSRYGYLFIFILPILCLFIYEIVAVVREFKNYEDE